MKKVFVLANEPISPETKAALANEGYQAVPGGQAEAYLLLVDYADDPFQMALHLCRCPACAARDVFVQRVRLNGADDIVEIRHALLKADGFEIVLPDGTRPDPANTEDEVVCCAACQHQGSLEDFGFYLASQPNIPAIYIDRGGRLRYITQYADIETLRKELGYFEIAVKEVHSARVRVPYQDAATLAEAVEFVLGGGGEFVDDSGEYESTIGPDEDTWWECDPNTGCKIRQIKYPS